VDKIGADPSNASESCVTAVTGPVSNGTPATVPDIANMLGCNPPASVPDTAKSNIGGSLDLLTDEQIAELLAMCMNDPAFAEAFKSSNPDIAASLADAEEANSQGTKPGDLLAGKELSAEEKMQILINSLENGDFACACSEIALDIKDDPEGTAASIDAIKNAIIASEDTAAIDEFARLEEEFGADPKVFLEKLHNSELLKALIADAVKANALAGLQALDPAGLDQLFASCANDAKLAGIMVASNAELANELDNTNDADALFSSVNGQKISPDDPITKELLDQIMTLDVITPEVEWACHADPNLVCTGSTLEDRTNPSAPEVYDTIGKLLDKFGKAIFDKALSAADAQAKKDELAIASDAQKLADNEVLLNALSEQGASSEQSASLEFQIGTIQKDLK